MMVFVDERLFRAEEATNLTAGIYGKIWEDTAVTWFCFR